MSNLLPFVKQPVLAQTLAQQGKSAIIQRDKGYSRVLQTVHSTFARRLEEVFGKLFGPTTVSLLTLQDIPLASEDERTTASPWHIFFRSEQSQLGVIEYSQEFALLAIDHLLGCNGELLETGGALSDIEWHILRDTTDTVISAYAEAWQRFTDLSFSACDAPSTEMEDGPLYRATYEARTSRGSGVFQVTLRLATWDGLIEQIAQCKREVTPGPMNLGLLAMLGDSTVVTRAILGSTHISVREVLDLKPGDIICLEQDPTAPVEIRIGDQPKFFGAVHIEEGRFVITAETTTPPRGA